MNRTPSSMHEYYEKQEVLPTIASLPNFSAFRSYASKREKIYLKNRHLPPALFEGARVLEFGPDSGENAMVLAKWGAHLTLVEPNPKAWPSIIGNFRKFHMEDHLDRLFKGTLQQFRTQKRFDFIVAEGFLYTVRPASLWIRLFQKTLRPGGFLILSHMETSGMLFDLLWKAVYGRMKMLTGLSPIAVATELFLKKWNTIPHTRSFQSWVMDMLENPFVRLKYCYEARWLYEQMEKNNFVLYSSWPHYQDALTMTWHKKHLDRKERLKRDLPFLDRSRLSFALGQKSFLYAISDKKVQWVKETLENLLLSIDALVGTFNFPTLERAQGAAMALEGFLQQRKSFIQDQSTIMPADQVIRSVRRLLTAMGKNHPKDMVTLCQADPHLLQAWGLPYHLAVFRSEKFKK